MTYLLKAANKRLMNTYARYNTVFALIAQSQFCNKYSQMP